MPAQRSLSASEVAKSNDKFHTWLNHNGSVQVSYNEIPEDLTEPVTAIFLIKRRIPLAWITAGNSLNEAFQQTAPDFLAFLVEAYESSQGPRLFTKRKVDDPMLFSDLNAVFVAWRRLQSMKASRQQWSEADYVGNVYNSVRNPGFRRNVMRPQMSVHLPEPFDKPKGKATAALNPTTAKPDCSIMLRASATRSLSRRHNSVFSSLNGRKSMRRLSEKGNSFRKQATPAARTPDPPCFEFASCAIEDKKHCQTGLDEAYRQNRMATTAFVRHLATFGVRAPIVGLVWGDARVRAHVDWWDREDDDANIEIKSAPYPGSSKKARDSDASDFCDFYTWDLTQPAHILSVYFLCRNIDEWTTKGFANAVVDDVTAFAQAVQNGEVSFKPWKKLAPVPETSSQEFGENAVPSTPASQSGRVTRSSTRQSKRRT